MPNLLPRWWFGDKFNSEEKASKFGKFKTKPRIGIVSSLSHYNVDNVMEDSNGLAARKKKKPDGTDVWVSENGKEVSEEELHKIEDDFDDIVKCVRETVKDF